MSTNIVDFLLTKNEVKNKIKSHKASTILSAKQIEDQKESTFAPKTNDYKHTLDQYKQSSGDRGFDLYNKVKKAQFTVKHDKTLAEYELEKGYKECTHNPVINHFSDQNPPIWRLPSDQEVNGVDKFMKRAIEGREQNKALKAAKDDRFGVIKQTKTGHKQAVHHDVGLMTVSQQG